MGFWGAEGKTIGEGSPRTFQQLNQGHSTFASPKKHVSPLKLHVLLTSHSGKGRAGGQHEKGTKMGFLYLKALCTLKAIRARSGKEYLYALTSRD